MTLGLETTVLEAEKMRKIKKKSLLYAPLPRKSGQGIRGLFRLSKRMKKERGTG